jgi:hypothetical protein
VSKPREGLPMASSSQLRIIVLGYIVRGPLGGMVWSNLQYLMGLARLGHDVYFVEDSDDYPSCYDPVRDVVDTDASYGLGFAARELERIGLAGRWAYWDAHTSRWLGPCADRILEVCATADLVLNLCGVNPVRSWLLGIEVRALVDEDPAFTQIRHLTDPAARDRALHHTVFFSFAENLGASGCAIPDDGFPWQTTRQPVVMDALAVTPAPPDGKFTTVMQWQSYPAREHAGVRYGMKSDSFMPYITLPLRAGPIFEVALGGPGAPRDLLRAKGWLVRDSREPTPDVPTYLRYIQQSRAEWSVAKHGYVVSRSGWFSERSVTYLASGRPVLIQDTGFSDWLPTGAGIVAFASPDQAVAGVEAINSRYGFHSRTARAIAEEYFDSRKVLARLIERAMRNRERDEGGRVRSEACRDPAGPTSIHMAPENIPGDR